MKWLPFHENTEVFPIIPTVQSSFSVPKHLNFLITYKHIRIKLNSKILSRAVNARGTYKIFKHKVPEGNYEYFDD
jgi:hypothetical protein